MFQNIKSHMSRVECHLSHVTCHYRWTAIATDPPPMCTAGWFAKTQKLNYESTSLSLLFVDGSNKTFKFNKVPHLLHLLFMDNTTYRLNRPRDRFSEYIRIAPCRRKQRPPLNNSAITNVSEVYLQNKVLFSTCSVSQEEKDSRL